MHPEGRLPFNLLRGLGTAVVVDVVVVDVFGALPAYEGPAGAHGQSDGPLVRTGGSGPHLSLDPEASPCDGPVLWGAGARRVADDSGRLAAGGPQDAGQVFVQNRLGVLVGGAREEREGVGGELVSTSHDLRVVFLLLLITNHT